MSSSSSLEVSLSFKGRLVPLSQVSGDTSVQELGQHVRSSFLLPNDTAIKLLYKGKDLFQSRQADDIALKGVAATRTKKNKPIKLLVMASTQESVLQLNARRSDPTVRGFDQEDTQVYKKSFWNTAGQDQQFKFCSFQPCTDASFGQRVSDTKTPHAFRAKYLLEQLGTDPGICAILQEREMVIGTLGEMDPIVLDQPQPKQTPGEARIDLQLRPESLEGFLPYPQIVKKLIQELSRNYNHSKKEPAVVDKHALQFWTRFAQMRADYVHTHVNLALCGVLIFGQTTLKLAGVHLPAAKNDTKNGVCMDSIAEFVLNELKTDMAPHGLSPEAIAPALVEHCSLLTGGRGILQEPEEQI